MANLVLGFRYHPLVDFDDLATYTIKEPEIVLLSGNAGADAHCSIQQGILRCDICGKPADTIHFVPWVVCRVGEEIEIVAACPTHDPGGYWICLTEFVADPLRWLLHLGEKRGAPDHALLRWLGYYGVKMLLGHHRSAPEIRCVYCGASGKPMELDHIIPKSRGGTNHRHNRAWACQSCNRKKGDRTLLEWLHELKSEFKVATKG